MASTVIPKNSKSRFATEAFSVQIDDPIIVPLLSRAQLLKTRGQWEEAVAVCTDAVRRSPASPSPYSLLGDIYHAQNKTDDALHWYRMALERNPRLPDILEKHDTLLAAKRVEATGNFSAAKIAAERTARLPTTRQPLVSTQSFPASDRISVERTVEWLDRVFPPGRSVGMTRLLVAVGATVAILVAVTGVCLFLAFSADTVASDAPQPTASGESRTPGLMNPPISAPVQGSLAASGIGTKSLPADAAPTPVPSLMNRLSSVPTGTYTVTAAQANLKNRQVQLEIVLPFVPGEEPTGTRNRILQTCAKASEDAYRLEPTVQRFLVRAILPSRSAGSSGDAPGGSLVFVGETSSVALQTLRTGSPASDSRLLQALFTNVWWANGLRITAK